MRTSADCGISKNLPVYPRLPLRQQAALLHAGSQRTKWLPRLDDYGSTLRPLGLGGGMIKSELILRIAEQNPHLFASTVEKAINAVLDEVVAALVSGARVELRGFGTFAVKTWGPRPLARNPKTGATFSIPETRHASFKASKEMRDRLNDTSLGR
jgi:integration host factor subunit beta